MTRSRLAALGRVARIPGQFRAGVAYAQALLGARIDPAGAAAAVRARQAGRADALTDTIDRAIFRQPASPYRLLLEAAGYDFNRLAQLVSDAGVESALRRLCQDGVYISVEEFKGLRPVVRGSYEARLTPRDFDNPLVGSGLPAASGGTRGRPSPTTVSVSNHRLGVEHLTLALAAYGLEGASSVVILPRSHGASLWAVLAMTAMGRPPARWFTQLSASRTAHLVHPFIAGVRSWCLLHGTGLPVPRYVPFGREELIVRELGALRPCAVITTASSALRVALAAARVGARLDGVTFVTVGEPLTPVKWDSIRRVGARAFSSLGFTEFGRATYGCAAPASADDTHLCHDAVAVIARRRPVGGPGAEVDALLFTALWPDARKILLNVETGDYARITTRRCGCPLEALGWSDHLEEIRSFEKLNAEGRLFFGSELIDLVERHLPAAFGGDPTDYQFVEQEDEVGLTRFYVLVHPRLDAIPEPRVLEHVQAALGRLNVTTAALWREAGTLQLLRRPPIATQAGKLMPLHHLGAGSLPLADRAAETEHGTRV